MSERSKRGVFLSASFPGGGRAEKFSPFDEVEISNAVAAISQAILLEGWRFVFGGHPTITPIVLDVASQERAGGHVEVFQSEWFRDAIPEETRELEDLGFGRLVWTPCRPTLDESLELMRRAARGSGEILGAVLIGGMEGITREYYLCGDLLPGKPRIPLGGPGGAAARLPRDGQELPDDLREQLASRDYPMVGRAIVQYLRQTASPVS